MPYTFEDQVVTLTSVHQQFPAYGENSIRDGLRAGHTTRQALLDYLVHRETASRARQGGRKRGASSPALYSRKPRGV
jgi:hypothetical protein